MRMFAALGLSVPMTRVLDGPDDLLEVERFDRTLASDGTITRRHQEDFCQASGRRAAEKYQRNGGPRFRDIVAILRRYSVSAADDIGQLVRAAVANICVGNLDAHAKNYALLTVEHGVRLAPFYDIVCNEVYPDLDIELSMNFGSTRDPRQLNAAEIARFAKSIEVGRQLVEQEIEYVTTTLGANVPAILHDAAQTIGASPTLDAISSVVKIRSASLRQALVTGGAAWSL